MTVEPKLGGRDRLVVLLKGGDDLRSALLSPPDGGKVEPDFAGAVARHPAARCTVEIVSEPGVPARELVRQLEAGSAETALLDSRPDIVVLSIAPDVLAEGPVDAGEVGDNLRRAVQIIKQQADAHVMVFNCSSVDPDDPTANYAQTDDSRTWRIHRLNLMAMELSMLEGVSVIDVDRLIAELGAGQHVRSVLEYSDGGWAAIRDEFLRIVADYGFFEERPLLMQVGRG